MSYLGTFGLEFQKTIVIFEIGTLEFVKNESLTHTINFGIGSALSKGPGVRFFGRFFRFTKYAMRDYMSRTKALLLQLILIFVNL